MRPLVPILLLSALFVAASAPAQEIAEPLDLQLKRARADQVAAEAEASRLERAAAHAGNEAARLRAEQAASARAIEAAEARITAADAQFSLVSAYLASRRQRMAQQQRPVAALLAGIAVMGQRPPLLALADRGSTDEFVKIRILLDSTLPVIRQRTAALSAELKQGELLQQQAVAARAEMSRSREQLFARRQQFAALEKKATLAAAATASQALNAEDMALAEGEDVEGLQRMEANSRDVRALATALTAMDAAPPRPVPPEGAAPKMPFGYAMPADAPVIDGLGSVNESGIRSRGLTLGTGRGVEVNAPAAGTVRFSGPYRDYDGILILDHGGGWMTLLLNVSSPLKPGERVAAGDPLGRALGPLGVELSQNGRRISAALIAGSSQSLSKRDKGG
jgi:septal ring factor EnvC (AmiA/AmiB activator)